MIIDELKKKGITSTEEIIDYLSRNQQALNLLPNNLAELVAEIAHSSSPRSCINLNSNIGEILSKCIGIENCVGVDANAQNVELSRYLNPDLHFENSNPLDYNTNKKFDSVICFPQLSQRIEINGRKIRSEELYVFKSLDLLNDDGKAILILPYSFLTSSIFQDTRSNILNRFGLEHIISLPNRLLQNTGIKLSIIVINKQKNSSTNFVKLTNREFTKSDFLNNDSNFVVSKENLFGRWDYSFHNPQNREYEEELEKRQSQKLENLAEVFLGTYFSKDEFENQGEYLWLTNQHISNGELQFSENDKYITKEKLSRKGQNAILQNGDILISRNQRNKEAFYVHSELEQKLIASQHFIILRGKNAEYVATYLNTEYGFNLFNQQLHLRRGSGVPILTIGLLKDILIPILPIEDLEFASKRKLNKLSYEELLKINKKYIALKADFQKLKKKNTTSAHEAQLNSMQDILNEVLSNQQAITGKLDDINSTLTELSIDFKQIKDLPRDIDEKINRLNKNLDSRLKDLLTNQKQLDFYITEIKGWFDFYDILESKSQKYLPEAEYIFDHISKLENPDFSPFILQYCRALENELLNKIFRAYVQSLIDRNVNLEMDFSWDFGRKESGKLNNNDTFKLGKHLQKCIRKDEEEWFFELGSMEINLRNLTGRTVNKSPLLKDFKTFVLSKFEQELLSIGYLDMIKMIINDYRNKSAHPNIINAEKAAIFHKQIKKCLISLMENYKQ